VKIDVHNHFYPNRFLKQLEKDGASAGVTIERDEWGRQVIAQRGNRVVTITPPMNNVEQRIEDMDQIGFEVGETLAKVVNDEFAQICQEYPNRFMAFATLPFLDPGRTLKELERCIDELKFQGACIGSNINGMGLDNEILYPFYERILEYNLPIHIHPRAPVDKEAYKDYRLGPMIGFEMDLCVAVVRLIMGGIMDRYPNLKFIVSHLGGAIPYLAERIQNCYEAYPECQENISGPAKDYLKRFYYDTVCFFEPALMCAYSFLGAERLVLGSDYPHVIGDIREAITSIEQLDIPQADKEMIFSGNILRLIHRNS
jgi:aminocarboxymuconate-semialdehyde decarboxylase